ncbi:MAG: hypothetical protein KI793_00670 [Rivularia sp. (in: Bacteria)]|nr:hypothetical protein [Rivularia sp. MS3]
MSDSATFEFETTLKQEILKYEISFLWCGLGYSAHIYSYPDYANRIFCTLDYIFGYSEEEVMIRNVVTYLLKIAVNRKVYYYRCADFTPLTDDAFPILDISVDDLFREEFRPALGASIMQKFLLSYL